MGGCGHKSDAHFQRSCPLYQGGVACSCIYLLCVLCAPQSHSRVSQAMFNSVPALPCSQLPRTVDECGAFFSAAPATEAPPAAASSRTFSAMSHGSPARLQTQHDYAQGAAPHDSSGDAADRAVAALGHQMPQYLTTTPGQGTAASGSSSPARARRPLCLCSQLEVLHYQHKPGERPEPVQQPVPYSAADTSEDGMDIGADDSFGA